MNKKKQGINRRKFISGSLAGIAGAFTIPHFRPGGPSNEERDEKTERKMIYRTLGKTGIKLPVISMGTMDATSEALLHTALDSGISHISTAKYYLKGQVEKFVGKVIKNFEREDIILATGIIPQPIDYKAGVFSPDTNTAKFEKEFEGSLKAMNVDYVDIFYLPFAAKKGSVIFEPLMESMAKMKKAGKARFLGIGTHSYVPEAVRAAADSGFYDVAMVAYNFMIKDVAERTEAINYAAGKGMGIVAMKTVTGESWMSKTEKAASNPKASLKWILQNENVHTTVPGISSFEELETDLSVMEDITLTPEEKEYLKLARISFSDGLFCQGCGSCLEQCSQAPDIPTLMRGYMYAYGYRNLPAAVRCIESVKEDPVACAGCSTCAVRCPMGFDIRGKVLDIIRLRDIPADFIC